MSNKTELLTSVKNPRIYAYTEPQYENTEWVGERRGKGLLKVGYTERDVDTRIKEQFPVNRPTNTPYYIRLDESAIRIDGTFFKDSDVHAVLEKMGVYRFKGTEWFEASTDDVFIALTSIKHRAPINSKAKNTFAKQMMKIMKYNATREFETLAKTISDWFTPIIRMWRFTKNNSITEGFHRKMKLIQRRAYGYRNFENYRLRVLVECGVKL